MCGKKFPILAGARTGEFFFYNTFLANLGVDYILFYFEIAILGASENKIQIFLSILKYSPMIGSTT